jgi:hypothetical protein
VNSALTRVYEKSTGPDKRSRPAPLPPAIAGESACRSCSLNEPQRAQHDAKRHDGFRRRLCGRLHVYRLEIVALNQAECGKRAEEACDQ